MQDMVYDVSLPCATVLQLEVAKPPSLVHTEIAHLQVEF